MFSAKKRASNSGVTILFMPNRGGESRGVRLSRKSWRLLGGATIVLTILLSAMAGSWWYFAVRASQVKGLRTEIDDLRSERVRFLALAERLDTLEKQYSIIRSLFGVESPQTASGIWLPPREGRARRETAPDTDREGVPTSWPLTEKGFITQTLLRDQSEEHQGLDIAVPMDSYIRASGSGEVIEVGEDPVYGRYVVLQHGTEYRTLYAHASQTMVEKGQRVRRDEVIAMSGSSGRSTAPHLHFEMLRNGKPIDPLSLVRR